MTDAGLRSYPMNSSTARIFSSLEYIPTSKPIRFGTGFRQHPHPGIGYRQNAPKVAHHRVDRPVSCPAPLYRGLVEPPEKPLSSLWHRNLLPLAQHPFGAAVGRSTPNLAARVQLTFEKKGGCGDQPDLAGSVLFLADRAPIGHRGLGLC